MFVVVVNYDYEPRQWATAHFWAKAERLSAHGFTSAWSIMLMDQRKRTIVLSEYAHPLAVCLYVLSCLYAPLLSAFCLYYIWLSLPGPWLEYKLGNLALENESSREQGIKKDNFEFAT